MTAATLRWRAWRVIGDAQDYAAIVPDPAKLGEFLRGTAGEDFATADDFVAWLRANIAPAVGYVIRVRRVTAEGITWTLHLPAEQAVTA